MTVVFLLIVIVILLWARPAGRDYTFSIMLLIAALTWLAIEIHLLRILGGIFAVAVEHWFAIVLALGAAVLLSVPALMIYIAVQDHLERHDVPERVHEARGTVRSKFERRVDTLMALGYGRTQAEITAVRQMKRDLGQSTKPALRDHS